MGDALHPAVIEHTKKLCVRAVEHLTAFILIKPASRCPFLSGTLYEHTTYFRCHHSRIENHTPAHCI